MHSLIPQQAYVELHVTFVITNASTPRASYFNLAESAAMPNTIFGTWKEFDEDDPAAVYPTFNSLNYLKPLSNSTGAKFGDGVWHVVKMFSAAPIGDKMLHELFGETEVGKSWSKTWLSYPKLEPVRSSAQLSPWRPDVGFYYTANFERLISTMETQVSAPSHVSSAQLTPSSRPSRLSTSCHFYSTTCLATRRPPAGPSGISPSSFSLYY